MKIYYATAENRGVESPKAYALLRYALARDYGVTEYEIRRTESGKPYIAGYDGLHISVSHTAGCVMCAVSDSPVGVDIQRLRSVKDSLVSRVCGEDEVRQLGFFTLWSLKESYIKLYGKKSADYRDIAFGKRGGEIFCLRDEAVFCRVYDGIPGCSCAAVSLRDDFPAGPEYVRI